MTTAALRYTSTGAEASSASTTDDTEEPGLRVVGQHALTSGDTLDFYGVFEPLRSVLLIAAAIFSPKSAISVNFIELLPVDLSFHATSDSSPRTEPVSAPKTHIGGLMDAYVDLVTASGHTCCPASPVASVDSSWFALAAACHTAAGCIIHPCCQSGRFKYVG